MTIEDKLKVVCVVLSLLITVLYIIQISKLEEEKDRAKQAEERLAKSIEEIEEYIDGEIEEDKNDDAEDARRYGIRGFISSETLNALIEVRSDCESRKVEGKCKTCKYYHSINCYEHRATEEIEKRGLLK
jgi:hypothetical protein